MADLLLLRTSDYLLLRTSDRLILRTVVVGTPTPWEQDATESYSPGSQAAQTVTAGAQATEVRQ